MKTKPELSVILVNYNDRVNLGRCLASLRGDVSALGGEVVLVDNHSEDGSPEFVKTSFPWAKLISNEENVGFARANNAGIRASSGEFILLLNTDTVVPPGTLAALLRELKVRPKAAAVGPALIRPDRSFQVSFGRRVSFLPELLQKFVLNPYYRTVLRHSRKTREVGWLSGACLLARRSALEAVGLFEEGYFLYFEDIDLCWRLKKKGYGLVFSPQARVVHLGGAATLREKARSRLEYRRSQLHFYRRHSSQTSLFLLKLYLRLLFFVGRLRGRETPEARARRRALEAEVLAERGHH